jgi:hypothetical protein
MPSGSLAFWASALHGIGYHSIPTRRASLISATPGQMELTIRRRMVPRSPSWALPTLGQVAGGKECGAAGNGKESLRPSAGGGYDVVSILSPEG